jgi:hypothetical protein
MRKQRSPNQIDIAGVGRAEHRTGSTGVHGLENLSDDVTAARSERSILESRKQPVCFNPTAARKHGCNVEFDGKFYRCPLTSGERCRY